MADINFFNKQYSSFKSSFKETSYDDSNGINLCSDETQEVINFDALVKSKYPDSNIRPKSFDAIYFYKDLIFCIEFKNQKFSDINNSEIQGKLIDGKNELVSLLENLNIQKNDYGFIYCVVYKDCKEPFDRYKCGITKDSVLFGLEKYEKNGLVKKVYTQNVSFYTKQLKKQLKKELSC